jgi:DNA polymerase-3 subunit delta
MPNGKPDKGAAALVDFATRPPPDVVCLVIAGKLDRKAGETAWVRAFEKSGVWVPIWPVDSVALPLWLRGRAAALDAEMDPEAAQLIVDRVEGNLLAAKQELEKLALLANGQRIDTALVLRSVGNSARYDVFQLGAAASAGDAERALRILLGLKSEGIEPPLILWALIRELRGLWQARERNRLRSSARAGWNLAATPSPQALARLGKLPLVRLMRQAHHTDRVIKGLAGGDAWTAITGLAAALAGALQATADSGRVAI